MSFFSIFIIYSEVFESSPGLWTLLTEKSEENIDGKYNGNDLAEYEEILRQTNVLYKDHNPNSSYPRSSGSWKWRNILAPIWEKIREESDNEKEGSGLIVKKLGRIWKAKRHSGKGYRKLRDGIYYKNRHSIFKL